MTNREFLQMMSDDDFAETIVDDGMFIAAIATSNEHLMSIIDDRDKCIETVKNWLNTEVEVIEDVR